MSVSDPSLVRPLGDPLWAVRKFFGWVLIIVPVLSLTGLVVGPMIQNSAREESNASPIGDAVEELGTWMYITGFVTLLSGIPTLLFIWRLMPSRTTNALYLRSFVHDRRTWPLRKVAQEALGSRFRLSGIRDPRRRRWLLDYLALGIFILRYSTPKFMNLEAGADWKARLWRSLGDARCALIDVSELTPFVKQEVELCFHCLGLDRILFIGEANHTHDEWRQIVAEVLPAAPETIESINVAVWDPRTRDTRRAFAADVRAFAGRVPQQPAGIQDDAFHLTQGDASVSEAAPVHDASFILATQFAAGMCSLGVGIVVSIALPSLAPLVGNVFSVVIYSILAWYFLGYLINTTLRNRVVTIVCLLALVLWNHALLTGAINAREAARRSACNNNLKQIGLALHNYVAFHGKFPPAYLVDVNGKPMHSWRVLILPYLGDDEKALYRQYRFNEPWNGPHNKRLAEAMPAVFRCPSDKQSPKGCTSYLLVIGQGLVYEEIADTPWRKGGRQQLADYVTVSTPMFADDFHGTFCNRGEMSRIIVVECANAGVNWLEPRDLSQEALSMKINSDHPHAISSHHGGGANSLCEFGGTEFLKDDTDPARLEQYFTISADELFDY